MSVIKAVHVGTIEYHPGVQWIGAGQPQIATMVRICLACGVEGVSVTWNDSPSSTAMALTIEAWFAENLVGFDIRHHPAKSESLLQLAGWHGTSCVAVAAIDNALWDAKAKLDKIPLHILLGSRHVELPAYAVSREELQMQSSQEIVDHILEWKALGFRAYKPHLWGEPKRDVAGCQAIRTALGDEYGLMFDPLGRYSVTDAVTVGLVIQQLGYLWFEDPIPGVQRHAYPWLAQRLSIPIIATDSLRWSLGDYIEASTHQCPIALRLDAGRQGITFCRKVMDIAAEFGVRCEFHAFGPEPNSVAGLHLALAQKAVSFYETCVPSRDYQVPGIHVPTQLNANGAISAPAQPGLGMEFDWSYLDPKINWIPRSGLTGGLRV